MTTKPLKSTQPQNPLQSINSTETAHLAASSSEDEWQKLVKSQVNTIEEFLNLENKPKKKRAEDMQEN